MKRMNKINITQQWRKVLSVSLGMLFLAPHSLQALPGGNTVGNGGDAVICQASTQNEFRGYYSLDFLAQYQANHLPIALSSLDESLERIEKGLQEKLPELLPSFQEFRKTLFNETDYTRKRLWEQAPFGLIDLQDESLAVLLPENCRNNGKPVIAQAVIRQPPEATGRPRDSFVYRYMPDVIKELRQTNPVQLSFLLVHEWLWDFSQNVDRNRRINYWLHSDYLSTWSREQWVEQLHGVGFSIPSLPDPAFDEQFCVKDETATANLGQLALRSEKRVIAWGDAFARTRLCPRGVPCPPNYWDTSKNFREMLLPHLRVEARQGALRVTSGGNESSPVVHVECEFDSATNSFKTCSPFTTSAGYMHEPELRFSLVVGTDCLRLQTKVSDSGGFRGEVQIDEYVMLFKPAR